MMEIMHVVRITLEGAQVEAAAKSISSIAQDAEARVAEHTLIEVPRRPVTTAIMYLEHRCEGTLRAIIRAANFFHSPVTNVTVRPPARVCVPVPALA